MPKKPLAIISLSVIIVITLMIIAAFLITPIRERIIWRVDQLKMRVDYALHPPEESVFIPKATSADNITPLPSLSPQPSVTPSPSLSAQQNTPIPQPSATALPTQVLLEGIKYEDQHGLWNYCAPANLAMQLSFWGWSGDRLDTGQALKPFEKDKNVMLYEMADYVTENTNESALVRSGGTMELLKALIANGFPVLVEKGVFIKDLNGKTSWMGHYAVLNGYDDAQAQFISQDSYFSPDYPVSYADLQEQWRSFNYPFLLVYPPEQEASVMIILGDYSDEAAASRIAYDRANQEIDRNSGNDLFFAWFNRGTSMVQLQDFGGAAEAYDRAFALYAQLPESQRPWRMLWYQTGPYFAYFYSGRYQDVINLASLTIDTATEPYIEESFYWRARAYLATGENQKAIEDLRTSIEYHPGFIPSLALMQQMGIAP